MTTRKCLECGATFTPRYPTQVCCTRECQRARNKRLDRENHVHISAVERCRLERKAAARRRAAALAARDAAYEREYGSPVGRPRGRLTVPLASFAATPCTPDSIAPIARFDASRLRAAVHKD